MQFRIWAEMHNGGLHPSLDEPPTSMFTRAGGGQATKKKPSVSANDPLSQAISQLAAALSPSITPSSSHAGRGAALGKVLLSLLIIAQNVTGEDADLFSDEADLLELLDEYLDGDDPPGKTPPSTHLKKK